MAVSKNFKVFWMADAVINMKKGKAVVFENERRA
jgi:hypothetical protein